MRRLGGYPARCLNAGLGMMVVSWSILSAGCAGTARPAWRDGSGSAAAGVAIARPAEESKPAAPEASTSGPRATVVPASFEEVGNAPSPASKEFRLLRGPTSDQGLTIDEVLQHTLDNHPLLRARAYEVEAARGRLVTAGLLPNPQWVLDSESPVDQDDATVLTTRLTFSLPTSRKRQWRMAAAEAGIARSRAALARDTEKLLAEAADASIEVLYLQERMALQSDLSRLATKTADLVTGGFQSGAIAYPATIRSRLDAAEIELSRLTTQGDLEQAQVKLNQNAGFPPAPLRPMRGELVVELLPPIQIERVLAEAERCRPELAESRAALLESQQLLGLARAEARPDVVFGPRIQDDLGPRGDRMGARMAVDVPLFDRNQGRIAERAALIHTQCAMVDVTQINTISDVAATFLKLEDVQHRLTYHRTQVQPIVEQTEVAIRNAEVGKTLAPDRISELLEQLVRMRLEELELRFLHVRLRTRLEILLGCPLETLRDADVEASRLGSESLDSSGSMDVTGARHD